MLMGLHSTILAVALLGAAPEPNAAADDTRALFDRASSQYETSQYKEAVETYTEAYQLSRQIEDEDLRALVQAAIFFNLAQAHSKAYALDQSKDHLLKTVDLLDKYLAQTADLADKADAEALLEQTKAELARLEQEEESEQAASEPVQPPAPLVDAPPKDRRGMRAGGFALVGLGVAAGGLAIGGAALAERAEGNYVEGPTRDDRDSAQRQGTTANALVLTGAISAGVFVTVGVALLVAGRKRKATTPTPSAWLSPTSAGVAIGGSF